MHLKILIGVLTLGLASASPKAKAAPQAPFQDYSGGQPIYYHPSGTNNFGQSYDSQPFPGQNSLGSYNVGFGTSNYGQSSGNPAGVPLYPQNLAGNYYQQSQSIPVPVAYSNDPSGNIDLSANYYGAPRLWPKNLVSPAGSPGPSLESSAPIYYPSSGSSPTAYQSTGNYVNPFFDRNFQSPFPSPSPVQAQYPQPIPVPVKVGSRNSFQPEITSYNTAPHNVPYAGSTPAAYLSNYQQQSTPAPVQSYQQPTVAPYSAYQQKSSSTASYVAQYQQPSVAPYQVDYQHQSSPAPYQANYQQQPNPAPYQANYQQQPNPAPYQANYQQQPTPAPYQANYQQQSTPAPYQANYQQQSTPAPYQANYQQQPTPAPYQVNYQPQPTPDPYSANYQQQPTPAPYQGNYQQQPTPAPYQVNYQQQPTPAPYQANYQQQSTPAPYQVNYQPQPTPAPYQANFQQNSTPSPFQVSYQQQPTSGSYVASYQQSTASPFAANQQGSTVSPYPPYQQPAGASYLAKYQQSTTSPFLASSQRIPVPVAYPHNQILPQPTKPSLISLSSTHSYPSIPDKSQSVTIEPMPTSAPATVSITEKTFIPVPSSPSPTTAAVVKSELINGNVSPQYNHIPSYSTASPLQNAANPYPYLSQPEGKSYGPSYSSANSVHGYSGYSPSTAVSQVSYKGLGGSYSY